RQAIATRTSSQYEVKDRRFALTTIAAPARFRCRSLSQTVANRCPVRQIASVSTVELWNHAPGSTAIIADVELAHFRMLQVPRSGEHLRQCNPLQPLATGVSVPRPRQRLAAAHHKHASGRIGCCGA